MIGLVLGGWVSIILRFGITSLFWGILTLILGVIYIFLKFFKHHQQTGVIGMLTLIELLSFACINGLISTSLWGGI